MGGKKEKMKSYIIPNAQNQLQVDYKPKCQRQNNKFLQKYSDDLRVRKDSLNQIHIHIHAHTCTAGDQRISCMCTSREVKRMLTAALSKKQKATLSLDGRI